MHDSMKRLLDYVRAKQGVGASSQVEFADIARALDATSARMTNWKSRGISKEGALAASRIYGCSAVWLLNGTGPADGPDAGMPSASLATGEPRSGLQEIDLENDPNVQAIPTVTLRLRAGIHGFSVEADADLGMPLFVPTEWMRRKGFKASQLLGLPVYGDSMEPTLSAGDKILINTLSTEPKDGKIFAINYEGEPIIKRLHRDRGEWWLSSDNADQRRYPRKLCSDGGCLLLGELVFRQSDNF